MRSFDTGIRIASPINGGAVFNQLENVTASNCHRGFAVHAMGSNANRFLGCRANACTIGVDIVDANNVTWIGGQIEVCTTGIKVTATSNGFADSNAFHATRFESNVTAWEVTSANVRDFQVLYPNLFAAYVVIDNGTRTTHLGNHPHGNKWLSQVSSATGSWLFERAINGGAGNPLMRLRDGVSTSGDPVTLQVEMERATAAAAFIKAVRAGNTYWQVNGLGHMFIRNRTTAPTVPADGGTLYVEGGALKYIGSGGTVTTIAPA
ncbi:hypothetical protein [Ornithinimicrobium sp. CNJ-824]|uniref:hypothetical protein n=1 Tax=Ornithinimicrobium sp. CNJ-824 TaxID=1904966 RepID=UPI0013012933|nr:hypothetical protein [Ornithinimicrobium sp. CNJ-824]